MPLNVTYPGVYIEELENPVKTIVGVSTSVTAFVGRALQGPVNEPTLIHNFGQFETIFGGLWKKSTMSFSVQQYFLNGGADAVIVRVFGGEEGLSTTRYTLAGQALIFMASNPGVWANNLKVSIDSTAVNEDDNDPGSLFHVTLMTKDANETELEKFLNVSHKSDHKRYVVSVLREESDLLRVDPPTENSLASKPGDGSYEPAVDSVGNDGTNLISTDIVPASNADPKKGIYALDHADIFNLLCIPPPDPQGASSASAADNFYSEVYDKAANYCKDKRAMLIIDPPSNWNSPDDPVGDTRIPRSENAVIYFPRIQLSNPLDENRPNFFPPSGALAGVIARTDAQRGVWKAPAGTEASMVGVTDFEVKITDPENGSLNQKAINCLRIMPTGKVVWGARTLKGEDTRGSQWKYLPVRRMALYIEETLYRNLKWVVFEPNDEPLWAQIRLNITSFMQNLFQLGAFQGTASKDAYLVKCDKETTTQYDIDRGIVNIVVGFAPLKPAEFVVIKIQQLAGQIEVR